jgi:hypothetical protein
MQLPLPFTSCSVDLAAFFTRVAGKEVTLQLTDNRSRMLSVKPERNAIAVRIHRIFLDAGMEVLQEVGEFVRGKRGDLSILRRYVQENRHRLPVAEPEVRCRPQGRYHDLESIFESINAGYFNGKVACHITWGARRPRRTARRRTLGSFSRDTNTITISPMLDRKGVPRYVVEFVVYHEMLHAFLGVDEKNGRRSVHSRDFRRREKLFKEYEKAIAWERTHPL